MGGMAAQIPIKDNREANEKAMANVRADKLREVKLGHDGYAPLCPQAIFGLSNADKPKVHGWRTLN